MSSSAYSAIKSSAGGRKTIDNFASTNPIFVCVISYTGTCQIPGITIAGGSSNLIAFTPAADAEFLYYGRCKSIPGVPVTPDGIPTPALITRAVLKKSRIASLIVDAGSKIKPILPTISFGIKHGGNIKEENGLCLSDSKKAFEYGKVLGMQLGLITDSVIIGESIPGGTTTALAVLTAFGIEARFKVSSSMPVNPHELKNNVIDIALDKIDDLVQLRTNPLDLIALVGDPMIPSVAGIACGALLQGAKVILAGGTQMTAVLCLLKALKVSLRKICIGTTSYVRDDESSDISYLTECISNNVPILSIDLGLEFSRNEGLKSYKSGIAKEGVGAGGASIAASLKIGSNWTSGAMLRTIEKEYENTIGKNWIRK
jgi:uncharacterized protein (TIGR00303 family)